MGFDLPELPVARAHAKAADLPTGLAVVTNDDLKHGAAIEIVDVHGGQGVAPGFRAAETSVAKTIRP